MRAEALILDTNLLVLFVVGTASRENIGRHKKLTQFTPDDFDALVSLVNNATAVYVTPHTLTETSNLASYIAEPARSAISEVLRAIARTSEERSVPSATASQNPAFIRLGLADAAVIESLTSEAVVLTTDLDLYLAALAQGKQAVNFNHLRELAQ